MSKTSDMAVQCAKLVTGDPMVYIPNFTPAVYWLSELHKELAREKSITHFRGLTEVEKRKYWNVIGKTEKALSFKILSCYACYMYELIKN